MLSFTHPHVVPHLYTFLSYVEHKKIYILKNFEESNCCLFPLTSRDGKYLIVCDIPVKILSTIRISLLLNDKVKVCV